VKRVSEPPAPLAAPRQWRIIDDIDEVSAEAAAVAEFELNDEQKRLVAQPSA
jgi:hypothetical protein